MQITGKTKLLGVIGDPITHSLSPVMHNAAIAHLGLDYVYLPFAIAPADLEAAIAGFWAIDIQGFNITIPHKQEIIPLLTEISPTAHLVGAVNTVERTPQGWTGTNTDVQGFIAPLKELRDWSDTQVLVLGYGGAARAVVVGCHQLGCGQIHVTGRDREKLQNFQHSWIGSPLEDLVSVHPWKEERSIFSQADLVVNTTPIGMTPDIHRSPVDIATILKPGAIAYDLIYNPAKTLFLQQAEDQGAVILNGLEMLVQQGAAALELWIHRPAPVAIMRQALISSHPSI